MLIMILKCRKKIIIFLFIGILSEWGCITKTISFKSAQKAQVSLVSPNDLEGEGTLVGDTPVSLDLEKVNGNIIRISQKGKHPVYWVVTDAVAETTEANINLFDAFSPGIIPSGTIPSTENRFRVNRVFRLLMRSYQALSGKRFSEARALADQATTIDPEIAAPLVIKALAFYQEGLSSEARAALAKAQALDPEDKDIETLMKTVGE